MNIRTIWRMLALGVCIAGTSGITTAKSDTKSNTHPTPALSKNAGKIQKTPIPLVSGFQTLLSTEYRKGKSSGPVCGGLVNGKPQPSCEKKPAEFASAALGKCPNGSFFDIGLWQCWACPKGYTRTLAAVDTPQACSRVNKKISGAFKKATFMGHVCPKGTFHDGIRDGECRKCPSGYKRSVFHVDTEIACHQPAAESLIRITRHSRAVLDRPTIHKCPVGQFIDGIDNYCYSCKSGYSRTGYSVRDSRACSRVIAEKWAKSSVVQKAVCEPSEFKDELYQRDAHGKTVISKIVQARGGSCWTCPDKFTRTVYAVNTSKACEKGGGIEYKAASQEADLTCPAGQTFDFIGLTAADIRSRPELKGKSISPVTSGTCWTCPTGYDRTLSGVKSAAACEAKLIEWYSRPFDEPGMFALNGAASVLLDLTTRHPEFIAASIREVAKSRAKLTPGLSEAKALELEKRRFADEPATSPAAAAAVFARIIAGITEPAKASAAEKLLIKSFTAHIIRKRLHVARDALAAYDAWKKAADYQQRKYAPGVITLGVVSPDFEEIALANTIGLTATGEVLARATEKLPYVGDALGILLGAAGNGFADFSQPGLVGSFALRTGAEMGAGVGAHYLFKKALTKLSVEAAKKAGSAMAQRLAGIATQRTITLMTQQGVTRAAATASTTAAGAGPQIIVAGGIMLVGMLIDHINSVADARPKIVAAVAHAKRDPGLKRLSKTEDGNIQMLTYWNHLTAEDRLPPKKFMKDFAKVSKNALNWRCGALDNRACDPKEAKLVCDAGLKKNPETNMCASAR